MLQRVGVVNVCEQSYPLSKVGGFSSNRLTAGYPWVHRRQ